MKVPYITTSDVAARDCEPKMSLAFADAGSLAITISVMHAHGPVKSIHPARGIGGPYGAGRKAKH